MNYRKNQKKYGWIWIIMSPILWLMAAISTVESITTYYIQLTIFSIVAIIGIACGIAALFQLSWAYIALKYLSWLSFFFFTGSGIVMLAYSIPMIINGNYATIAILFPIALCVIATGLPFYFMAKNLS